MDSGPAPSAHPGMTNEILPPALLRSYIQCPPQRGLPHMAGSNPPGFRARMVAERFPFPLHTLLQ